MPCPHLRVLTTANANRADKWARRCQRIPCGGRVARSSQVWAHHHCNNPPAFVGGTYCIAGVGSGVPSDTVMMLCVGRFSHSLIVFAC